jgi:hypothetical protein
LHGYPQDYFRFSKEALALIFADAGPEVVDTGYLYPCKIVPPAEINAWDFACLSFLNVYYIGRKGPCRMADQQITWPDLARRPNLDRPEGDARSRQPPDLRP